jgi:DDE family transposase
MHIGSCDSGGMAHAVSGRRAHKTRSRRQDGYKAHLVVEPETGIITDAALTPASGPDNSDAAVGIDLLAGALSRCREQPLNEPTMSVDSRGHRPVLSGDRRLRGGRILSQPTWSQWLP